MCLPIVPLDDRTLMCKLAVLSGLSEPAGAFVGLLAVNVAPGPNLLFRAYPAGAMIYVSIHELYPLAKRYRRMPLFLLGLLLSVVAYGGLLVVTPGLAF